VVEDLLALAGEEVVRDIVGMEGTDGDEIDVALVDLAGQDGLGIAGTDHGFDGDAAFAGAGFNFPEVALRVPEEFLFLIIF
jgi:hypothetical protein